MRNAAIVLLLLAGAAAVWPAEAEASTDPGAGGDVSPDAGADAGGSWMDAVMGTMGLGTTRGERNNNPGNIRLSSVQWQGQIPGADAAFVTFATPADGIRALAKLLKNYQSKYGLNTIRGIVSRYAPSSENNTAAYIQAVAADMGIGPDAPLDLGNAATLDALVTAIIHHENGRVSYAAAVISDGVARA